MLLKDGKSQEDKMKNFKTFLEEKDICKDCGCDKANPKPDCDCCGDRVDEALSIQQRRKKAINLRKNKAKLAIGRKKAANKIASHGVLKKRAQRAARNQMVRKITKGVAKGDLTNARKAEMEKRLDKMKPRINRIAKRLIKDVRKKEIARKRGR